MGVSAIDLAQGSSQVCVSDNCCTHFWLNIIIIHSFEESEIKLPVGEQIDL